MLSKLDQLRTMATSLAKGSLIALNVQNCALS